MAVIDERGRVFGLINLIDAGLIVLVAAIVAAVAVGYAVFRVPAPPELTAVEPPSQTAFVVGGPSIRVLLRGKNFLPFMRVVVQPTGDSEKAVQRVDGMRVPVDRYALVNTTEARFFVESPSSGEVWLADGLPPGTYDVIIFNESEQVALKEAAFTLTPPPGKPAPPPAPPPPVLPLATVRTYGVFTGLAPREARTIAAGARFGSTTDGEWVEVLSVDPPAPDIARLGSGDSLVPLLVENRVQVPALARVRCSFTGNACQVGGTGLVRDAAITVQRAGRRYAFHIQDLVTDLPEALSLATVKVRFVTRPEIAALIKVGDTDNRVAPPRDRTRQAASLTAQGARHAVASNTQLYPNGEQSFTVQEQLVEFEGTLRVPLTNVAGAWMYKGQPVKAGGTLVFETPAYALRGWILTVDGRFGASPTP